MQRREVLKVGAVAAAAATVGGTEGCATVPHGPAEADHEGARTFLAQLDRCLALAVHARPADTLLSRLRPGPRSEEMQALVDKHDDLFRYMLRTLYITQSFRDLPEETQLHPEVQARMQAHLPEVDSTVFAVSELLSGQTQEQRMKLREHVRDNPRTAMDLGEALDEHAERVGASKQRRRQLRKIMSQVTFRLKHEAPGALIDEYTAKVERMRGQDDKAALALAVAQKLGEKEFWKHQQRLAQAVDPTQPAPAPGSPMPAPAPAPVGPPPPPPAAQAGAGPGPAPQPIELPQPGRKAISTGAYMMGIGIVDFGVGLAIANASKGTLEGIALVAGVTVGAVLFAIGFLVLLVGIIIAASN